MDAYDMKPAVDSHDSASKMSEYATPKPAAAEGGGEMKLDSIELRPAANGGVIASCRKSPVKQSKDGPSWESPKEYAFSGLPDALAFVQQEFGG